MVIFFSKNVRKLLTKLEEDVNKLKEENSKQNEQIKKLENENKELKELVEKEFKDLENNLTNYKKQILKKQKENSQILNEWLYGEEKKENSK